MILYKYYGHRAGLIALQSKRLGFRVPSFFNDPFELTSLHSLGGLINFTNFFNDTRSHWVAILALTKSFDNPLMWSHYADSHKGIVIGYDVDEDFLTSHDLNIIPVTDGDVTYIREKTKFLHSVKNLGLISALEKMIFRGSHITNHLEYYDVIKMFFVSVTRTPHTQVS